MAGKDGRSRNWNFVLYPESAPVNWREIIDETHIEWVESPLHDMDFDPTGEPKKPHHHVTLLYPSDKTESQVKELVMIQLKQPIPIRCISVKGSIRYMAHKDNPEKHQYNWNEIVPHGGADINALCMPTTSERMKYLREICEFITENEVTEFADFINMCIALRRDEWFYLATQNSTLFISNYVRSRRYSGRKDE